MPVAFTLNRTSEMSLVDQVDWNVREAIRTFKLMPGERLPRPLDLATRLGCGNDAVKKAYAKLAKAGVIVAANGKGHFVPLPAGTEIPREHDAAIRSARTNLRDAVERCATAGLDHAEIRRLVELELARRPHGTADRVTTAPTRRRRRAAA